MTHQGQYFVIHPPHFASQNPLFINFEDGATIKSAEAMSVLLAETHGSNEPNPKSQNL
jgi:hypothetical protein